MRLVFNMCTYISFPLFRSLNPKHAPCAQCAHVHMPSSCDPALLALSSLASRAHTLKGSVSQIKDNDDENDDVRITIMKTIAIMTTTMMLIIMTIICAD